MNSSLITGINGFVGQWLTKLLIAQGYTIFGIDLQDHPFSEHVHYQKADLLDSSTITSIVKNSQPEFLFNLAGVTYLPDADSSPKTAIDANITGTLNLLDAVKTVSTHTKMLFIGSSREYSDNKSGTPHTEDSVTMPANFYGISKLSSELIALQYHRQFGIDVRCTRSFNHTGPGQSPRFVCSEWARNVARIALGKAEPVLSVGGLDASIDFSDVRDVVDAYYKIVTQGTCGEAYNVCSGTSTTLKWILDYLVAKSPVPVTINQSSAKVRSKDASLRMIGSFDKISRHTGWRPSIPFEQTLDDLYQYWLKELDS